MCHITVGTFGIKKCKKMHIGEKTMVCDKMKVHDKVGENVDNEKYIGDVLCNDGSNFKNIQERIAKGYGIVNEIISIKFITSNILTSAAYLILPLMPPTRSS